LRAANEAARGQQEAIAGQAAQFVATARNATDLSSSAKLRLAVAAFDMASTPTTQGFLLDAILDDPGLRASRDLRVQVIGKAPISATGGVLLALDGNVLGKVFDAATLEPLLRRSYSPAPSAAVRNGDRLLGVVTTDRAAKSMHVVDLQSGDVVGPPEELVGRASQVALSPDGTRLAVPSDGDSGDGVLSIYDVTSGRRLATLEALGGSTVRRVVFSPNGEFVLGTVDDADARLWETETGEQVWNFTGGPDGSSAVTRIAMSPAGTTVAIGRESGSVELWNASSGSWEPFGLQSPHFGPITSVDFDAAGERLVSTSADGQTVVWNTRAGRIVAGPLSFDDTGDAVSYFRPGSPSVVVTIGAGGQTWEWDLARDNGLATIRSGASLALTAPDSPDGSLILSSPEGWAIGDPLADSSASVRLSSTGATPRGIAASRDGSRVVVVVDDTRPGRVELHDADDGALVTTFEAPALFDGDLRAGTIALDRRGTKVAYQSADRRITIVDADGTTLDQITLDEGRRRLQSLDLSPDGSELIVSTDDGVAIWYDLEGVDAGLLTGVGTGFDGQFVGDDRVAFVGRDGAQIVEPRSGRVIRTFPVDENAVRLGIDPSGRLLATTDSSGTIQLWDADGAGRIGGALPNPDAAASTPIRFSADGHHLIAFGRTNTALFTTWVDDWPAVGCSLIADETTPEDVSSLLPSVDIEDPCS
jgi:WD40 repeat protein